MQYYFIRENRCDNSMRRHVLVVILLLIMTLTIAVGTLALAFTRPGGHVLVTVGIVTPTPLPPTPIPSTPTPTPRPILTAQGSAPTLSASAAYLLDMDTGHTLADVNGEKPLPMASTAKIMTALIAIRIGDLNQLITIKQDAYDEYAEHDGSNAGLMVGEQLTLKDLLYALMVPSGNDAAIAIADRLGGTTDNFVQWMNLFAYRLHLFQTHYTDPDGLNWRNDPDQYTTAADLTRLADYAMQIPLFAQIVQTQSYSIEASAEHSAHSWTTTNTLLAMYTGMLGIKTGHTDAAGYCIVFAAEQHGHHLIGTVLHSAGEVEREQDVSKLLDWGFALPLLPPAPGR
jgi:serine-type D-Ala-D-Ala carboxypeptidase (penicillin-binding protein 5/6)